ncbi:ChaB family protein [Hyphomicrobium sp.]|uniref:ChaB family protein n=1 Tax=Hyphomicrobium sp. TaxID=82 RepID=UPI000FA60796|nr:ChaB family protein [Hyphomicrobium sp.]RUO98475.1 MAG: cation transporter [Hyphomicrobium sp.]
MPYAANDDLPASVRENLPEHAQDIFRAAFNSAYDEYGGDEEASFRIAWAAVKRSYVKEGGEWVPKGVPG